VSSPVSAGLAGVWGALRVPFWLRGRRWTELLSPPAGATPGAVPPRGTARAAVLAVRVLAAVPGSPWRYTCLYRSVAECLALRRFGVPAVVRIGVRSATGAPDSAILAHAWVVMDPDAEPAPPDQMLPFSLRA
jgi:Transglutaminase-like superfamily